MSKDKNLVDASSPLPSIAEVEALIRYAAENGSTDAEQGDGGSSLASRLLEEAMRMPNGGGNEDDGGNQAATRTPQDAALSALQGWRDKQREQETLVPRLYSALAVYRATDEGRQRDMDYARVLELYSSLTRLTAPVTGRTILETRTGTTTKLRWLLGWSIVLLGLGLGLQMIELWLADTLPPESGWLYWLSSNTGVITHVSPFVWGAIGSMVYLLKYLYDIAQIQAFDANRYHGIGLRVCLGAIVGGVTLQIFDTTGLGAEGQALSRDAFAFLAGLGVRVVYGAMEKLIQLLSDKLNLESVRTAQMKNRPGTGGAEG